MKLTQRTTVMEQDCVHTNKRDKNELFHMLPVNISVMGI